MNIILRAESKKFRGLLKVVDPLKTLIFTPDINIFLNFILLTLKQVILTVIDLTRIMRGTLGGAEHRNTAENIDKYRNTAKKIGKYHNQEGGSVSIVFPYSPTVNSSLPV